MCIYFRNKVWGGGRRMLMKTLKNLLWMASLIFSLPVQIFAVYQCGDLIAKHLSKHTNIALNYNGTDKKYWAGQGQSL